MIRAAVEGVVDFSQANLLDPRWHKRLYVLLSAMVERDRRAAALARHQRSLAYIAVPNIGRESFTRHHEQEKEAFIEYLSSLFFQKNEQGDRKKAMAARMRDAWAAEFGDLDSPETQKKIDDVAAALRHQRDVADAGRKK